MPTYGPDELLCHCTGGSNDDTEGGTGGGPDRVGHGVGAPGCGEVVRQGTYRRAAVGGAGGAGGATTWLYRSARGTCPVCGRTGVTVTAPMIYGRDPSAPAHRRGAGKGVPLGKLLQLGPHPRPGRAASACPGAGRPPVETRFTPPSLITDWVWEHGPTSAA